MKRKRGLDRLLGPRVLLSLLLTLGLLGCGGGGDHPHEKPPPLSPAPWLGEDYDLWVCAVGDVLLDRWVGEAIARQGTASILAEVAPHLRQADLTFGNLECPLASEGPRDPFRTYVFRADPRHVEVLTLGGFGVVSVANNHTLNSGHAALVETLDHLDAAGIAYVGSSRDPARGSAPTYLTARGLTVGFLAYTDLPFEHESYSRVDADLTGLRAQVAAARQACDLLLVSFHWGEQDRSEVTSRQVAVARATIEAGADAVLGHHPHVLQGIEVYRGRPILYSMGNFVFDPRTTAQAESAIFDLVYRQGRGWEVWITPVTIPWSRLGPEYATGWAGQAILRRLQTLSDGRGTRLDLPQGLGYLDCGER